MPEASQGAPSSSQPEPNVVMGSLASWIHATLFVLLTLALHLLCWLLLLFTFTYIYSTSVRQWIGHTEVGFERVTRVELNRELGWTLQLTAML